MTRRSEKLLQSSIDAARGSRTTNNDWNRQGIEGEPSEESTQPPSMASKGKCSMSVDIRPPKRTTKRSHHFGKPTTSGEGSSTQRKKSKPTAVDNLGEVDLFMNEEIRLSYCLKRLPEHLMADLYWFCEECAEVRKEGRVTLCAYLRANLVESERRPVGADRVVCRRTKASCMKNEKRSELHSFCWLALDDDCSPMPFPPGTSTPALVACECIGFRFQCGLWNGKAQDCIGLSLIGFGNGWCRKDKRSWVLLWSWFKFSVSVLVAFRSRSSRSRPTRRVSSEMQLYT
ncbi:hypothetical protein L1049_012455 [Liquidambar formosana]|uniref:Uncharacterized protein n=1 Tax=Liquidambar formosana TaxID=63359 RepID=A0AAP0N5J7_LIQFO